MKTYNRKKHYSNRNQSRKPSSIKGILKLNMRGIGYLKNVNQKIDIEIENKYLNNALNNDEVLVILSKNTYRGRAQGKVIKILKRSKNQFVGVITMENTNLIFTPDDKKLYKKITISKNSIKDSDLGKKVLVKIISWGDNDKNPEGEVNQIIGVKGEHETEMRSIVLESGLDMEFSKEIENEAKKVAEESLKRMQQNIPDVKDFRKTVTFTIDPETAKDFDDALSFKRIGNNIEVGVHIADVSYYVREGGLLDKEALERGFSTYLVDRTIPMLPEILSNGLCSLNPNEDRLSFSAVFNIDQNGKILNRWFGKSIIKSQKRFSYEEAQDILNKKEGLLYDELNTLNDLAKKLRTIRFKNGAIDFDTDEVRFELEQNGVPTKVYRKQRLDTHKLVEELMLLANREVAKFVFDKTGKNSGFIYRVHDTPDKDRIKNLSNFLKILGYQLNINVSGEALSKNLNALFTKIEGKPEEPLIKTASVRSMAKAVYSTKNIGHFGLAFRYYTHFTSPIRRYADLMVHRFLEKCLQNKKFNNDIQYYQKIAEEISEKEIKVSEAERDSIKYKQIEFMLPNVGKTFDGVISGVTEWGMYVEEVLSRAEGLIKIRDLGDDFYVLNEKQYSIVGKKNKRKFQLGDKIKIKVKRVDLENKQIDYELVDR